MKKKISLIIAQVFIGSLVFGVSQFLNDPEKYQSMNPNARRIMDVCEVSENQVNEIWNILKDCGVSGIKTIDRDELLDCVYADTDIGYRVKITVGHNPILYLNDSGEVHLVRWQAKSFIPPNDI